MKLKDEQFEAPRPEVNSREALQLIPREKLSRQDSTLPSGYRYIHIIRGARFLLRILSRITA